MSADPPSTDPGELQFCITDIELQPPITDPNCKICVKVFLDDKLVCSLPWIDNTQPLRWSRLILCYGTAVSRVSLRLCRSLKGKQLFFTFPSYQMSDVDEESGHISLEHPELIWVVTVKSLIPTTTEQIFADEIDKLSRIDGVYDSLKPQETAKYLYKTVLKLASIAAEVLPGRSRRLYFVLFMKAWEILERQTQLDESVQKILQGLVRIQDVIEVLGQAPNTTLDAAMGQSKEPIDNILELLKDASVYIFNRLAAGDSVSQNDPLLGGVYNIEGYLDRLETLQKEFHDSWSPPTTLSADTLPTADDEPPVIEWEELPVAVDEELTKLPDPFEILNSLQQSP